MKKNKSFPSPLAQAGKKTTPTQKQQQQKPQPQQTKTTHTKKTPKEQKTKTVLILRMEERTIYFQRMRLWQYIAHLGWHSNLKQEVSFVKTHLC